MNIEKLPIFCSNLLGPKCSRRWDQYTEQKDFHRNSNTFFQVNTIRPVLEIEITEYYEALVNSSLKATVESELISTKGYHFISLL